jgi:hypothetical protein
MVYVVLIVMANVSFGATKLWLPQLRFGWRWLAEFQGFNGLSRALARLKRREGEGEGKGLSIGRK